MQSPQAQKMIMLSNLHFKENNITLSKPISASITQQNNLLFCKNDELGIIVSSNTIDECLEEFQEELLFIYNEYGKEKDEKLTADAKELKRKILQYIDQ